ncbi:hypothetical protein PHYBLDRAFT_140257 [Phycomyces blakesleeanus NRRL 1555(-)]|uniref:Major facilitator superfamily (MFS) profile domain-containing protein n=1 Tax=Phycomyces blakesleeanus (strain ATCC 8743b / DSM 1359 / FGSC 10004 / NBRC 33097 / NRRL 1555) TaxID=763407 RepID=A0A162Y3V7_PHYB8|nr:hypothetical protein PHYBLDRAFT_140257 [Phycomyces blakesleeanus NRRL 1555(-)]OAD78155.1 hypothetical protein PHYBLDRAFT_140257 [Phycomyces blakesleeanus NRRL 1555(-)]|eukprot:XP_018296195.1 hypothetical protein PHYBLDRAFT_140257 [Phycomyces blakesleeanus NRRL 1555(-)]
MDGLSKSYTDSIYSNDPREDTNALGLTHSINSNYSGSPHDSSAVEPRPRKMSKASLTSVFEDTEYNGLSVEPTPTPLPRLQMFIISIILFSEPLTSTILFPFIYFMIKDFHLSDDEKEIGAYAGWITSVFFLAQFSTAIQWGKISDNHGRRPVLLTGLIGNSISACMFGLSKNLWWAIGARAFCGIVNGNSGVARSMVSEITDSTNRAKAFSIFGFCWGIGMIGPALGGYLSRPVEGFPEYFGDNEFLKEYPYFLPCFVSSIGSFIGFLIGYFYLNETNPLTIAKNIENEKAKQDEIRESNDTSSIRTNSNTDNDTERLLSADHQTSSAQTYKTFSNANDLDATGSQSTKAEEEPKKGYLNALSSVSRDSALLILAYSLFGFHSMVFDEILPLYFLAPTYAGGLGSTSPEFAKALSILGIQQLIIQFFVYPRLSRSFSTLVMTRFALVAFVFVYFLFPELSTVKEWVNMAIEDENTKDWVFRGVYMSLLFVRYLGNCLAFTSLMILVSNSAPAEALGTVNGVCQSCLSLVRAFAPTIGGTLWSISLRTGSGYPFDHHMVYYIIGTLAFFGLLQTYSIPADIASRGRR